MTEITKSLLLRFARSFVAGAVGTMVPLLTFSGGWGDLKIWLSSLALAGIVGGISGCLQAIDKALRIK
jgi:hypothetical protein